MRRFGTTLLVGFCSLSLVSGCSTIRGWFGAKKTDPYAEAYDQSMSAPAAEDYPVYEPLPATAYQTYPTGSTTQLASQSTTQSTTSGARYHTVSKKDTLYSIARMYYNGDQSRWREIYDANRGEINDPNKIFIGQRLVIP